MSIFEVLQSTGLPCVYDHFAADKKPPYIAYIGDGQDNFAADNTYYHSKNHYQVEYYFEKKNEANEQAIETALLENGYLYEKSEDAYIESQKMFVIYYYV